jgi:hypothetical protein
MLIVVTDLRWTWEQTNQQVDIDIELGGCIQELLWWSKMQWHSDARSFFRKRVDWIFLSRSSPGFSPRVVLLRIAWSRSIDIIPSTETRPRVSHVNSSYELRLWFYKHERFSGLGWTSELSISAEMGLCSLCVIKSYSASQGYYCAYWLHDVREIAHYRIGRLENNPASQSSYTIHHPTVSYNANLYIIPKHSN